MNEINLSKNTAINDKIYCIYDNCINIPEILYSYNPLKSDILYRCNFHSNKKDIEYINLSEFLQKSSNIKCFECQLNITNDNLYYCKVCKNVFDFYCSMGHINIQGHEIISINKNALFNNCLDHKTFFSYYCAECNKSLCNNCDISFHKNLNHNLIKIVSNLNNKKYKDELKSIFNMQKIFLEKIKKINNKIFQSLENDIEIKQRIIENNETNIYNYQSNSNFNCLEIKNNNKYETLLKYIINKEEEIENDNNNIDKETFLNRILSPLYYSMMINTNISFNNSLMEILEKNIKKINDNIKNNINEKCYSQINNHININDDINYIIQMKKGKEVIKKDNQISNIFNNNFNINNNNCHNLSLESYQEKKISDNNKNIIKNSNISNLNIFADKYLDNKLDNNKKLKSSEEKIFNTYLSNKDNFFFDSKNININNIDYDNSKIKINNIFEDGNENNFKISNKNFEFLQNNQSIQNNLNINNFNINYNSQYNSISKDNNIGIKSPHNIQKNIPNNSPNNIINIKNIKENLNNSNNELNIINNNNINQNISFNDKNINLSNSNNFINSNNESESIFSKPKIKENKNETHKKHKDKKLEAQNNCNNEKELNKKNKINNSIFNMIILSSGNYALSMKEAIEIYDFRKLNFSEENNKIYKNKQIKESNCLLQRINLVKGKKISYVFEFPDKTLLCATFSRIFRIKLTDNDTSHYIIGIIKLNNYELPIKLISLGDSILVALSEIKRYCNLRVFIKNNNTINNINSNNDLLDDNNINNSFCSSDNNQNNSFDCSSNDFSDVPPIGNSLFVKKDINIDKTFELIQKNINKDKKLLLSIYEIKKNINNEYLYEFIATSNKIFDLGDNRIEFYGVQKIYNGKLYFTKIKIINNISCSVEINSICQIKDKYLCVGLQNHDLKGQISGIAIIDIFSRDICRIIRDQEISCLYFSEEKNILFASMECRDIKQNYFMTKIFKIIKNVSDKGKEEIDLKKIYEYRNDYISTISSILEIKTLCFKLNIEKKYISEDIICVSSSLDSNLEIIKITNNNK